MVVNKTEGTTQAGVNNVLHDTELRKGGVYVLFVLLRFHCEDEFAYQGARPNLGQNVGASVMMAPKHCSQLF